VIDRADESVEPPQFTVQSGDLRGTLFLCAGQRGRNVFQLSADLRQLLGLCAKGFATRCTSAESLIGLSPFWWFHASPKRFRASANAWSASAVCRPAPLKASAN
jgi:hypothetical protein